MYDKESVRFGAGSESEGRVVYTARLQHWNEIAMGQLRGLLYLSIVESNVLPLTLPSLLSSLLT